MFVLRTEVEFEPVADDNLMAAGGGAVDGAGGVFIAVAEIKVLKFGGDGGDYGIVPSIAKAENEELGISRECCLLDGVESEVGLH